MKVVQVSGVCLQMGLTQLTVSESKNQVSIKGNMIDCNVLEEYIPNEYIIMEAIDYASECGALFYGSGVYNLSYVINLKDEIKVNPKNVNIIFKTPKDQTEFLNNMFREISSYFSELNTTISKKYPECKFAVQMLPSDQNLYTNDILWDHNHNCVSTDRILVSIYNPNKNDSEVQIMDICTKSANCYGTFTNDQFVKFALDRITLKKGTKFVHTGWKLCYDKDDIDE